MNRRNSLKLAAVLAFALAPFGHAGAAQDEVVIGVLYPLTGPVAQVGIDAVAERCQGKRQYGGEF